MNEAIINHIISIITVTLSIILLLTSILVLGIQDNKKTDLENKLEKKQEIINELCKTFQEYKPDEDFTSRAISEKEVKYLYLCNQNER